MRTIAPSSLGVGLRSEHAQWLSDQPIDPNIDFLELTIENWLEVGGRKREQLDILSSKYPLIAHGLSLSIGDTLPLNIEFIKRVKRFLDRYQIDVYSDHLSYSRDKQGYLYDLLPIPRSPEMAVYISEKIRQAQYILERTLILENISYYYNHDGQMNEAEFINEIVERSQCQLLLDINNAYVNGVNHDYDPLKFIANLPSASIRYFHIAGHWQQEDGVIIDTHGANVCGEVIELAKQTIKLHGTKPLVLERDNHLPSLKDLCGEVSELGSQLLYSH
ncbi:DUF692 domain-containing protein [Iodobacter fluviatilis]|uniref:DUF692 domain-containing protein n=1 Tax=Iodobacter fluviatilis TaxID=537 RepID=A0A7G3GC83_9NEIS|nr:DUF692 domain-containing protein [Iodobacter fluviatilis]QBC44778.1 hypothetical protein C1H71_15385 [Iodobacter fluviatilis]